MAANPISITVKLQPKAHQTLFDEAKRQGYGVSVYAQMLFDAAFAARIGQVRDAPSSDAELDQQVSLALILAGIADTQEIARATGLSEPIVQKILDGLRTVRGAKKRAANK